MITKNHYESIPGDAGGNRTCIFLLLCTILVMPSAAPSHQAVHQ